MEQISELSVFTREDSVNRDGRQPADAPAHHKDITGPSDKSSQEFEKTFMEVVNSDAYEDKPPTWSRSDVAELLFGIGAHSNHAARMQSSEIPQYPREIGIEVPTDVPLTMVKNPNFLNLRGIYVDPSEIAHYDETLLAVSEHLKLFRILEEGDDS